MAGDWIKFEHATLDKPEVLLMAELLETSPDDVIGKLLRVWVWFDQQSENGNAGGVTYVTLAKFIDRHVSSQGFAACMKKVGWLSDEGMPHFDRHNGESAKKRALTKDRVAKARSVVVTLNALPEKRREEVTPIAPDGGSAEFTRFWKAWPASKRKNSRHSCATIWRTKKLDALADSIIAHVEAMKSSQQWREGFEPAPKTYLNGRRWEDGTPQETQPPHRLAV